MIIPFLPTRIKARWNVEAHLGRINAAIEELQPEHFRLEIKSLHPRLAKFDLILPPIDPVGGKGLDDSWCSLYRGTLKTLRRQVRDGEFVLREWNAHIMDTIVRWGCLSGAETNPPPDEEQTIPLPTALDKAWPMLERLPPFSVCNDEPPKLFLNLTHRMFDGSDKAIPLYGIRVHRNTPERIADAHKYKFSADASNMASMWNANDTVRDLHVYWADVQNWIAAQRRISQPRAPRAATWIPEAQALQIIRASSLVRLRIPNDVTVADTLARALGDTYKTPGEQRAGEVSRHLLREFGSEIPGAVRSDQYGKEPLEWWIDKEADRRTAT